MASICSEYQAQHSQDSDRKELHRFVVVNLEGCWITSTWEWQILFSNEKINSETN